MGPRVARENRFRAGSVPSIAAAAAALMRSCIYGVWYTEELIPLFEYIRETERTVRPLRLTGVDVQTSWVARARDPLSTRHGRDDRHCPRAVGPMSESLRSI